MRCSRRVEGLSPATMVQAIVSNGGLATLRDMIAKSKDEPGWCQHLARLPGRSMVAVDEGNALVIDARDLLVLDRAASNVTGQIGHDAAAMAIGFAAVHDPVLASQLVGE